MLDFRSVSNLRFAVDLKCEILGSRESMDLVEQIDLTVNPPQWRAIDRRNRVVCDPAPLIYYRQARERDTVPESSTAMGSRDSAEVNVPGENDVGGVLTLSWMTR